MKFLSKKCEYCSINQNKDWSKKYCEKCGAPLTEVEFYGFIYGKPVFNLTKDILQNLFFLPIDRCNKEIIGELI